MNELVVMRRVLTALLVGLVASFCATATEPQKSAAATPSVITEPGPEISPPPTNLYHGAETQVTISQTSSETVEEASVNGTLVWIKVTPRYGRPYYLIPADGGSTFVRRDSLDTGLRVPMWVLFSW